MNAKREDRVRSVSKKRPGKTEEGLKMLPSCHQEKDHLLKQPFPRILFYRVSMGIG